MIKIIFDEFIAVVDLLLQRDFKIKNNILIVPKDIAIKILEHNAYMTYREKLQIWKAIGLIRCDEDRLTKRFYDSENKKYIATINIRLEAYNKLKELNNM